MYLETLKTIIQPANLPTYIRLTALLIILTITGITLFHKLSNTRNKFLIIGGGMIAGPLGFLLILTISSYIFKGPTAILILFFLYNLLALPSIKNFITRIKNIQHKPKFNEIVKYLLPSAVILAYSILFFFLTNASITGGDVGTYWSIATSFARGNYPTVSPWQPELLTVYHEGTSLIMGSLQTISGIDISITHFFLSFYLISALFIFMSGLGREYTRSPAAFIVPIVALVLFASPLILISNPAVLFQGNNPKEIILKLAELPAIPIQGIGGNCGGWLGDFVFCNFRAFGYATLLLFIYLLAHYYNTLNLRKYIVLVAIAVLTLSIDESLFFAQGILLAITFVAHSTKEVIKNKRYLYQALLIAFTLTTITATLFFLIQNPIRDSLLNPKPPEPRFKLLEQSNLEFASRLNYIKAQTISINKTSWYLPDLRLLLVGVFLIALYLRSRIAILSAIAAIACTIQAFLFVDNYYAGNGYRFLYSAYNIITLAVALSAIQILLKTKSYTKIIIVCIFIFLFIPQLLVVHAFIAKYIDKSTFNNFTQNIGYRDETLVWISKQIPFNKRILFIDEYPKTNTHSPITSHAMVNYGMFVPTSPPTPKILNGDVGGEWFDVITQLSPQALAKLKVEYLFVDNNGLARLSENQKSFLNDQNIFKKIGVLSSGKLYKISPIIQNVKDSTVTTTNISQYVNTQSAVYVHTFPFYQTRRGLLLNLMQRNKVSGPQYTIGGDFFMHIEYKPKIQVIPTIKEAVQKEIEYLVISPENSQEIPTQYSSIGQSDYIQVWKLNK